MPTRANQAPERTRCPRLVCADLRNLRIRLPNEPKSIAVGTLPINSNRPVPGSPLRASVLLISRFFSWREDLHHRAHLTCVVSATCIPQETLPSSLRPFVPSSPLSLALVEAKGRAAPSCLPTPRPTRNLVWKPNRPQSSQDPGDSPQCPAPEHILPRRGPSATLDLPGPSAIVTPAVDGLAARRGGSGRPEWPPEVSAAGCSQWSITNGFMTSN